MRARDGEAGRVEPVTHPFGLVPVEPRELDPVQAEPPDPLDGGLEVAGRLASDAVELERAPHGISPRRRGR